MMSFVGWCCGSNRKERRLNGYGRLLLGQQDDEIVKLLENDDIRTREVGSS
jgi:hypothetical protein